jgi:adenylate cyclase
MAQIFYLPDQRLIQTAEAYTVLDASLEAGIPHTHVCGGNARCSTCRVMILTGQEYCGPRTEAEQALAKHLSLEPTVRLACQTELVGNGPITLRRLALDGEDLTLFYDQALGRISPRMMGQEKHVAILFADIRGFTTFSEALLPYDVIYVLNRYFQRMAQVIERYDGTINVYMGDGLMALFGLDNPDRAVECAVRAGLDMLKAVEQLNPSLELLYNQGLRIGIGVHYGYVVIGTIGDPKDPKVTAIGDAVNLASRVESANKQLGTTFLISADAFQAVQEQIRVSQCFQVPLAGKSGEYCLYEVAGISAPDWERAPTRSPLNAAKPTVWARLQNWLRRFKNWLRWFFSQQS